jgi:predicted RNase H-like HicB family nuclease
MSFPGSRQRRTMTKHLEYYRLQPYARTFEIRAEGSERYLLYRIKEIPTVAGDGATKDEALRNLRDAFDDYITWALDEGLEIADASRLVTLETTPAVPSTSVAAGTGTKITSAAPRTVGPATRRLTAAAA